MSDRQQRDHALAMQRFLGGVQVFGGVTLVAAYALGAPTLGVGGARAGLIALGVLQVGVGVAWLIRPATLRVLFLRRPGTLVAVALLAATLTTTLGGSGAGRAYITATQCWLIVAGLGLPGRRWLAGLVVVAGVAVPTWLAVEGASGGFEGNGDLTTAALACVASVSAGLWMGRVTGDAVRVLNRWYLVEVHELGLVGRLREALVGVQQSAERLAEHLSRDGASDAELGALRRRLADGVDVSWAEDAPGWGTSELLARLRRDGDRDGEAAVRVTELDGPNDAILSATVADAVYSVLQRQIENVARHAPNARVVTVRPVVDRGTLLVRLDDDGGGPLPVRAGEGSAWSVRQLARVGGTARYYAGEAGVGFEVRVPVLAAALRSADDGLSVRRALERFGVGLIGAVLAAGAVGDTLTASATASEIGLGWLVMPAAAVAIGALLWFGRAGAELPSAWSVVAASALSAAATAWFIWPSDSPKDLVVATTSVLVPALALYAVSGRAWILAEALRLLAVAPLLVEDPAGWVGLAVIYPTGIYLIIRTIVRFTRRAGDLEARAADAVGRANMAAAVVRGLSLRHDAIDVLARHPTGPEVEAARHGLQGALDELDGAARATLDPGEVVATGVAAALGGQLGGPDTEPAAPGGAVVAGAIDRLGLIELAALAADERASCTPPGVAGRRRLRRVELDWARASGGVAELTLVARPSLAAPDEAARRRLEAVAGGLGVEVDSTSDRLTLSYSPR